VFTGTRLPVPTVIENLKDLSIDEVIQQFDVTREQITAVLDFVAQSPRTEPVPAGAHRFDHGTPKGLRRASKRTFAGKAIECIADSWTIASFLKSGRRTSSPSGWDPTRTGAPSAITSRLW
jgi:hypothetical protein